MQDFALLDWTAVDATSSVDYAGLRHLDLFARQEIVAQALLRATGDEYYATLDTGVLHTDPHDAAFTVFALRRFPALHSYWLRVDALPTIALAERWLIHQGCASRHLHRVDRRFQIRDPKTRREEDTVRTLPASFELTHHYTHVGPTTRTGVLLRDTAAPDLTFRLHASWFRSSTSGFRSNGGTTNCTEGDAVDWITTKSDARMPIEATALRPRPANVPSLRPDFPKSPALCHR